MYLMAVLALGLTCIGSGSAWAQPAVETLVASASSEWGAGYGAEAAVDGIAAENGNYWQTVEKTDRGAWGRWIWAGSYRFAASTSPGHATRTSTTLLPRV